MQGPVADGGKSPVSILACIGGQPDTTSAVAFGWSYDGAAAFNFATLTFSGLHQFQGGDGKWLKINGNGLSLDGKVEIPPASPDSTGASRFCLWAKLRRYPLTPATDANSNPLWVWEGPDTPQGTCVDLIHTTS